MGSRLRVMLAAMADPPAVLRLLARQDGLLTDAQARCCGLSPLVVRNRLRAGGWQRVAPGVLLAGGHPWTDRARLRAAGLWVGDRGALSGPAAAWWHGLLSTAPPGVTVTVARSRGLRAHDGVQVRRRDLHPEDLTTRHGIRLTAPALTALETAATVADGSAFVDRVLQRHVRFPALYRAYCRNLGSAGSAGGAALLMAAADRADSAAERLFMTLVRQAGITGWERGFTFGAWTVDFAFRRARVAVEVDGWAWHVDVDRFRADRRKGNALVQAGWVVLRFTWHDLTNRPSAVVTEIRSALA